MKFHSSIGGKRCEEQQQLEWFTKAGVKEGRTGTRLLVQHIFFQVSVNE